MYQARPETRQTGSTNLDIPTLFLALRGKLDVKDTNMFFFFCLYVSHLRATTPVIKHKTQNVPYLDYMHVQQNIKLLENDLYV